MKAEKDQSLRRVREEREREKILTSLFFPLFSFYLFLLGRRDSSRSGSRSGSFEVDQAVVVGLEAELVDEGRGDGPGERTDEEDPLK